MTDAPKLPESLRRAVRADLGPVRPLAAPARRALLVGAWAAAAAVLVLSLIGPRQDAAELGWWLAWGVTAVQVGAGLALVSMGLSAAVPGRGPARGVVVASVAAGVALFVVQAILTGGASAGKAVADPWLTSGPPCLAIGLLVGLGALAVASALIVATAPLQALRAALLAGTGTGLLAEAAQRLHCSVTDPRHLFPWHGGGVLLLAAGGIAAGWLWERRRSRELASRLSGEGR